MFAQIRFAIDRSDLAYPTWKWALPQRIAIHQRPHVSKPEAIAVGVGVDIRMIFKIWDYLVDEVVDRSLIGARHELLEVLTI